MSLINDAARIMRIGDEFSETNQKLIQAVDEFVEWLYEILNGSNPPFECGLNLFRLNGKQIQVTYYWQDPNAEEDEIQFITHAQSPDIVRIVGFCKYLTKGYGKMLADWMQEATTQRKNFMPSLAKPFSDKQIAALKYLIFKAKNGGRDLSKRIQALLIEKSECLTKDVCISLVDNREGYSGDEIEQAAMCIDSMLSSNGTTHLDAVFSAMGSEFGFSIHYGDFDPKREGDSFNSDGESYGTLPEQVNRLGLPYKGMPNRYTFWLSRKRYSREAELIPTNRAELDQIDITKSGLYKHD